MKVYFDNKIIRLSKKRPDGDLPGTIILEYSTLIQVGEAFQNFISQTLNDNLVLWSENGFSNLKHDFFSLFKYIKAAGGAVKNEKNELLIIFRYGRWDLPKGKIATRKPRAVIHGIQEKESPELPGDAALREVMEETGLTKVRITGKLASTYHIYSHKEQLCLKKTYWFSMYAKSQQPLVPQLEEEISLVRWISSEEIQSIAAESYPSLKKIFSSAIHK
jgi:8-oxo-dGTP pyrophosphatase MutT (NUDIX family)